MQKRKNGNLWRAEKRITKAIQEALQKIKEEGWNVPEGKEILLQRPRKEEWGDFSSQIAFNLAGLNKKPPQVCAENLVKNLPPLEDFVEKVEVVGGFINFTLGLPYLFSFLTEILKERENFPRLDLGKGKRVLIEFVSANPTGPLHIGHGRGAAIGSALSNLLEKGGYKVEREYYVNNVGRQIELLGESLALRLREIEGEKVTFSPDHYQGEYLKEMAETHYKELKEKKEDIAYLSRFASQLILEDILETLKNFGVEFDRITYEDSLYKESRVEKAIEELKKKKGIYEKDGALWLASTQFGDEKDRVIVRKDRRPTYLASDIAYHKEKFSRGYDLLVNIWGADHHGYIPRLRAGLKFLGLPKEKLKIILVQMVSLIKEGKKLSLSTRKGEFVSLEDLIEEVGKDVCRFFFLTRRPDTQLEFNIDLAKKEAPENPVYYIQYAHARIASIFRKWEKRKPLEGLSLQLLKEPEEIKLLRLMALYPWLLEGAINSLEPHRLTAYLQELANAFHRYYDRVKILGGEEKVELARLGLVEGVRCVIASGLKILGIQPRERM
ncbi:arginine--tRNA ligase [Candidatus Calescamantes bacterium]|nr:arginine--tRNA ligase [Candidatus Calescamantes bacterium]